MAENTYTAGTISVDVDTFREDVAAGTVADVLTFPTSEDLAAEKLETLEAAYADASASELEAAFADTGLSITITDVPAVPDDDAEVNPGILEAIKALPGEIADSISGILTADPEEAEEQLSLPALLCQKFPFCIPFDLIHLVQVFAAEKEVPRFELPLKFDYRDFHYEQVFVVDLSDFDSVILIFRILEDLLFCAGLITITRSLIRG